LENVDAVLNRFNNKNQVWKCFKGKRALEKLCTEFALEDVHIDMAERDIFQYFSDPNTLHNQSPVDATRVARSLFPRAVCVLDAVLLLTFDAKGSLTRNLAKVLMRLEREEFEVLDVRACAVAAKLMSLLIADNKREYSYSSSAAVLLPTEVDCVAILLRANSALLKLKRLVGPVLCEDLANLQYPKSLAASLINSSSVSTNSSPSYLSPSIIGSLTNFSAIEAIAQLFPHKLISNSNTIAVHGSHNLNTGDVKDFTHSPTIPIPVRESFAKLSSSLPPRSISLKAVNSFPSTSVEAIRAKNYDIAGIVITYALIKQVGLAEIIDVLFREGIQVLLDHINEFISS